MRDRHLDKLPVGEIVAIFGTRYPLANYPERFKIAPTDPALSGRFNPNIKRRTLDALRWGRREERFRAVLGRERRYGLRSRHSRVAFESAESAHPRARKSLVRCYDFASNKISLVTNHDADFVGLAGAAIQSPTWLLKRMERADVTLQGFGNEAFCRVAAPARRFQLFNFSTTRRRGV
jgi:hypothetical protein